MKSNKAILLHMKNIVLLCILIIILGCSQQNNKKALPLHISKLIADGSSSALHKAGIAYETGDGVNKDLVQAAKWYYEAATKGNIHSHYAIWCLWEELFKPNLDLPFPPGQFEKSRKLAIMGYEKMVKQSDDPELYYRLGLLYEPGIGMGGIEEEISNRYLAKAAKMGHEEAKQLIEFIQEHDLQSKKR